MAHRVGNFPTRSPAMGENHARRANKENKDRSRQINDAGSRDDTSRSRDGSASLGPRAIP